MNGQDQGWECSICLSSHIDVFGIYFPHKLKCKHQFHIGCIQQHFIMKNKIWEDPEECVLECPLCRDKTIKNNFGVNVKLDQQNNQMILKKGEKSITFTLTLFGKDVFKRDIQIARNMLQNIANMCFDVDCYWLVAQYTPLEKMNKQYADSEKQCAKLICLPTENSKEIYIERSFGLH